MWNRQEQGTVSVAHELKQRIAKSFCFRPPTDVLTGESNAPPGGPCWVKFPTVWSLSRVKCPGIARGRGGMSGFGIDWYITLKQDTEMKQKAFSEL